MLFLKFFTTPLGIVVGLFSGLILLALVLVVAVGALAFTGGPGPCTPGSGAIEISDANSQSFDTKWKTLDDALAGGTASPITLSESELSSRANKFVNAKSADVSDLRVCIHNGYGEVTGSVDVFLGSSSFKVKGTVALSSGHPVVDFQDIEVGNVPGFVLGPLKSAVEDAIQHQLDDLKLKHTYSPTLTDGQAQIAGTP